MEVVTHEHEALSLVALEGRLDADGVDQIETTFAEATAGRGLPTVVDMSGISFMSSLGIGFLFSNAKKLKKAGSKLVLLNPRGMVEGVLKTSKMERVMPVFFDLEEAVVAAGCDASVLASLAPKQEVADATDKQPAAAPTYTPGNVLKLEIANEMSELTALYAAVNEFLVGHRVPYRPGYAVNLAIEELVVNVIRYAYVDDDRHMIEIGVGIFGDQIVLELRDTGRPFDPRNAPTHDPEADDLEAGGLGLILVLDIVDTLSYRREDDKNHVRVCVKLDGDESGELWTAVDDSAAAGSD